MHRIFSFLLIFIIGLSSALAQNTAQDGMNCFSILVGKKATVDGSVLLAHNEDDFPFSVVNWYKVLLLNHKKSEQVRLKNGGRVQQAEKTFGFFWLEMPGFDFSDSYMNQWGVTIASNQCKSKEQNAEFIDGGIGYYLRRLMAERAKTAREAVKIGGELIERFGYTSSGRTYCIADPNEAWMLAAVMGKHWVAERIPDDQVAIIPNYYTIGEINLKDTLNFLGSADIVDYAIKKGWYNPKSGKPFNFRKAYGDPVSLEHYSNIGRHWAAINLLSSKHYDFFARFPFSFKPKAKIALTDLMKVLRNHYEGTQLEMNPAYNHGNPHKNVVMRICSQTNRYGFVAQLRSWLPPDVGNIWWIAPHRPCVQPFVPWYYGIEKIPQAYTFGDCKTALRIHFNPQTVKSELTSRSASVIFIKFAARVDSNYAKAIPVIRKQKEDFQKKEFLNQKSFEDRVLKIYRKNPVKARQMLTKYSVKLAEKALRQTKKQLKK